MREFLYAIPWYEMDHQLRKDMRLILLNSEKPLHMTGFHFFMLSYETFIVVRLRFSECNL